MKLPNGEKKLSPEAAQAVSWNEIKNVKEDFISLQQENKDEHEAIMKELGDIKTKQDTQVPWKVVWVMKVEAGIIGILASACIGLLGILFGGHA